MMKKLLLTGVAFTALSAGSATAADLARPVYRRPVVAVAPVYGWTGFYVGGNVGYAWSRATMDPSIFAPNCTPDRPACPGLLAAMAAPQNMTSNGFTGGFQAGANYQTGPWVVGIEADIESFRLRNSFAFGPTRFVPPPAPGSPITLTSSGSVDTNWLATVRPRVGVAFANLVVYATGGVAFTKQNNTLNDVGITTLVPGSPQGFTGTVGAFAVTSSRDVGWTAGGGIEYAIAPHWSLKAEYLHLDFGSATASAGATNQPPPALCPCGFTDAVLTASTRLRADIVRVGLNYKFGYAAAPAVYK
jgi:outer membrane immunogenic protein